MVVVTAIDARRNHHRRRQPHRAREPAQGYRSHKPGSEQQQRARSRSRCGASARLGRRRGELVALHHQHSDVVLASHAVRRLDQLANGGLRIAGIALHGGADLRRRDLVAEAVAAQQQRAIGLERKAS